MRRIRFPPRAKAALTISSILLVILGCDSEPTKPTQGLPLDRVLDLAWDVSSDGNIVLYAHRGTSTRPQGLYLLDLRSTADHRYIAPYGPVAGGIVAARLSPSGARLAVLWAQSMEVSVLDLATGADSIVTAAMGNVSRPDWSPSEDSLVYARPFLVAGAPDTTAGLYLVALEGTAEQALLVAGSPTYGAEPRWSPDGGAISYTYGILAHVHLVAVNGSIQRDLTQGSALEFSDPHWASSHRIVAQSRDASGGNRRTVLIDVASGTVTQSQVDLRPYGLISALTSDGRSFVYSAPDPGNTCYVLYKQAFNDASGATRVQITNAEPISVP